MRSALLISVLILLSLAPLQAQGVITDGTGQTSDLEWRTLGTQAYRVHQTFVPRGTFLTSISFYFTGFYNYSDTYYDYVTALQISGSAGTAFDWPWDGWGGGYFLDQQVQGWYTVDLPFIPVVPGAEYALRLMSHETFYDDAVEEGWIDPADVPTGWEYRTGGPVARVGVTGDVYANGQFHPGFTEYEYYGPGSLGEPGVDMAFEVTTVTPEPGTVFLLGTGLLALGIVVWRRREEQTD